MAHDQSPELTTITALVTFSESPMNRPTPDNTPVNSRGHDILCPMPLNQSQLIANLWIQVICHSTPWTDGQTHNNTPVNTLDQNFLCPVSLNQLCLIATLRITVIRHSTQWTDGRTNRHPTVPLSAPRVTMSYVQSH